MNESYISNQNDDLTSLSKINDRLRRLKIQIFRKSQNNPSVVKRNRSEFVRNLQNISPGSPQPNKNEMVPIMLGPNFSYAEDQVNSINTSSLTEMRVEHAAMNETYRERNTEISILESETGRFLSTPRSPRKLKDSKFN
jgi:hypothetical protein